MDCDYALDLVEEAIAETKNALRESNGKVKKRLDHILGILLDLRAILEEGCE